MNEKSKKTFATIFVTILVASILIPDNIVFNRIHFLQLKGCAMDTICAPIYANVFIADFEEKDIYLLINNM